MLFPRSWQIIIGFIGITAALLLLVRRGAAQQTPNGGLSVAMAEVMTPEELASTGVATLTESQRHELDLWLNRYTLRVLQIGTNQSCQNWDKESLQDVADDGEILTTDSGAVLDVDLSDRGDTALWTSSDDILLHCNGSNCTIINLDEQGETAGATRRRKIAAAQKARWAAFRKAKAANIKS